jgi:hypothetical protein
VAYEFFDLDEAKMYAPVAYRIREKDADEYYRQLNNRIGKKRWCGALPE